MAQILVYRPAQYDPDRPAAVMVFQDGQGFLNPKGAFHVPAVFDNLIDAGEMPVTIGVFINPGNRGIPEPGQRRLNHRSIEHDSPNGDYARFLETEILSEVGQHYALSGDPEMRAICGNSSVAFVPSRWRGNARIFFGKWSAILAAL